MFVENFAPALFAFEDAKLFEFLEVLRGGFAFGKAGVHEELDFAVGLGEDDLDEFLEHRLIGDEVAGAFELGEGPVGGDASFQDGFGFQVGGGRQERQGVRGKS